MTISKPAKFFILLKKVRLKHPPFSINFKFFYISFNNPPFFSLRSLNNSDFTKKFSNFLLENFDFCKILYSAHFSFRTFQLLLSLFHFFSYLILYLSKFYRLSPNPSNFHVAFWRTVRNQRISHVY